MSIWRPWQDRHRWYESQWVHMIDSTYWESVSGSHGVFDFQDMGFNHGFYQHWDSWTFGTGPDYYSEMVPRGLSTWDTWIIVLGCNCHWCAVRLWFCIIFWFFYIIGYWFDFIVLAFIWHLIRSYFVEITWNKCIRSVVVFYVKEIFC